MWHNLHFGSHPNIMEHVYGDSLSSPDNMARKQIPQCYLPQTYPYPRINQKSM
jgi:hypothetical protein